MLPRMRYIFNVAYYILKPYECQGIILSYGKFAAVFLPKHLKKTGIYSAYDEFITVSRHSKKAVKNIYIFAVRNTLSFDKKI